MVRLENRLLMETISHNDKSATMVKIENKVLWLEHRVQQMSREMEARQYDKLRQQNDDALMWNIEVMGERFLELTKALDMHADPEALDMQAYPKALDMQADPKALDMQADPKALDMHADPKALDMQADPKSLDMQADPKALDMQAYPKALDMQANPKALDMQAYPKALDMQADPKALDMQADPKALDLQADPNALDMQAYPKALDMQADPKALEMPADPKALDMQAARILRLEERVTEAEADNPAFHKSSPKDGVVSIPETGARRQFNIDTTDPVLLLPPDIVVQDREGVITDSGRLETGYSHVRIECVTIESEVNAKQQQTSFDITYENGSVLKQNKIGQNDNTGESEREIHMNSMTRDNLNKNHETNLITRWNYDDRTGGSGSEVFRPKSETPQTTVSTEELNDRTRTEELNVKERREGITSKKYVDSDGEAKKQESGQQHEQQCYQQYDTLSNPDVTKSQVHIRNEADLTTVQELKAKQTPPQIRSDPNAHTSAIDKRTGEDGATQKSRTRAVSVDNSLGSVTMTSGTTRPLASNTSKPVGKRKGKRHQFKIPEIPRYTKRGHTKPKGR